MKKVNGVLFAVVSLLVLSCNETERTVLLDGSETEPAALTYGVGYIDPQTTEMMDETIGRETLWSCVSGYCNIMHNNPRYGVAPGEFKQEYYDFRQALCTADLLMEIARSDNGVLISDSPESLKDVPNSGFSYNFNLPIQCGGDSTAFNSAEEITIEPLTNLTQRADVREMAFRTYYAALANALVFADSSGGYDNLADLIAYSKDNWFYWLEPERSSGEMLAKQMFAQIPTVINTMREVKMEIADEMVEEGKATGDEWTRNDVGRMPALIEIAGSPTCSSDEVLDSTNGWCWKRCPIGQSWNSARCVGTAESKNWVDAAAACESAGAELPSAWQARSVLAGCSTTTPPLYQCNSCSASPTCDTWFPGESRVFWTATKYPDSSLIIVMDYSDGDETYAATTSSYYTRCIRRLGAPSVALMPNGNQALPPMSNALRIAASILKEAQINVPCFARYESAGPYASCDPGTMESTILDSVNAQREKFDQVPYGTLSEYAEGRGTTPQHIGNAVQYLYTQLLRFPRATSVVGDVNSPTALFTGWEEPTLDMPVGFYASKYSIAYMYDSGIPELTLDSGLNDVGLVPVFRWIQHQLRVALHDPTGLLVSTGAVGNLSDALLEVHNVLGDRQVVWTIQNLNDRSVTHLVDLVGGTDCSGGEGVPCERFRVYPIENLESPDRFANAVCLHKNPECNTAGWLTVLDWTIGTEPGEWDFDDPGVGNPPIPIVSHTWVLEMATTTGDGSEATWTPLAIVDVPVSTGSVTAFGYTDGSAMQALKHILSADEADMSEGEHDPIGDIDGIPVRKDFVPAIENELTSDGDQYETSYRHYMDLARTAAEKAAQMRDELVTDVIEEAHEEGLEQAQLQSSIDNYMSSVQMICGDNVMPGFEEAALAAFGASDFEAQLSALFADSSIDTSIMHGQYGCVLDDISDECDASSWYRTGQVQCAVPRNCSDACPNTLQDYGVLDGLVGATESKSTMSGVTVSPLMVSLMEEAEIAVRSGDGSGIDVSERGDDRGFLPPPEDGDIVTVDPLGGLGLEMACTTSYADSADFLYPQNIFEEECIGADLDAVKACVMQRLFDLECWAKSYKAFIVATIRNQKVGQVPTLFNTFWQGGESDFFDVNDISALGFNYGDYYTGMQTIGTDIDSIRVAAAEYVTAFDDAIATVQAIRDGVKLVEAQTDLQIAQQIATLTMQQALYNDQLEDETQDCLDEALVNLGETGNLLLDNFGLFSEENIGKSLEDLDAMFNADISYAYVDVNSAHDFNEKCLAIAKTSVFGADYGKLVCDVLSTRWGCDFAGMILSDEYSEIFSTTRPDCEWGKISSCSSEYLSDFYGYGQPVETGCTPLVYKCDGGSYCRIAHGFSQQRNINIYTRDSKPGCNGDWNYFAWVGIHFQDCDYDNFASVIENHLEGYEICRNSYGGTAIENNYASELNVYRPTMCNYQREAGDGAEGYAYDPPANVYKLTSDDLFGFDLPAQLIDEVKDDVRKAIRQAMFARCQATNDCQVDPNGNIDPGTCEGTASTTYSDNIGRWQDGGDLEYASQLAGSLQSVVAIDNLTQKIVETGMKLAKAKSDMATGIRRMAMDVGNLNALEQKQISVFKQFINDVNVAQASSYSNLAEWQTRFDFRRQEYREQLQRARYLAWQARRAVEFRLGIDLSDETQATPYGDIPRDWVDEIYEYHGSECYDATGDEATTADAVASCLTEDELIEKYVQKLEDYVEAYGNSGWWFHEDDDTGVVSMRDHLYFLQEGCPTGVGNLLCFSEEMNMTSTQASTYYGSGVLPADATFWTPSTSATIVEEEEGLGVPAGVAASHITTELGIFEDQLDQATADGMHVPYNTGASLSQDVPVSYADAALGSATDYEFSIYHRSTPVDEEEDCGPGQSYFPTIGRCGVPCYFEDTTLPPPYGSCGEDWPAGTERPVCMYAGLVVDDDGEPVESYMCDDCTADRGCYYQNGQAIAIEVGYNETTGSATARHNVQTYPFWVRDSVSSFADRISMTSSAPVGTIRASVVSRANVSGQTKTNNLVRSSEMADHPNYPWTFTTGTMALNTYHAPDGTFNADAVNPVGGNVTVRISASTFSGTRPYTGSLWLRSPDGTDDVPMTLRITASNGGTFIEEKQVIVSPTWRRYEVTVTPSTTPTSLYVQVIGTGVSGSIGIWGVQIETGFGSTPYHPTGKNALNYVNHLTNATWTTDTVNPVGRTQDMSVGAPDGAMGAWVLTDDSTTAAEYLAKSTAGRVGVQTFSLWMASATPGYSTAKVVLTNTSNGISDPPFAVTLEPEWRRYYFLTNLSTPSTSQAIEVKIFPAGSPTDAASTGSIWVWGPQLEKSSTPSGYQYNYNSATTPYPRAWAMDVGLSGASLVPADGYACTTGGSVVYDRAVCLDHYDDTARTWCCMDVGEWWLGTAIDDPIEFVETCRTCDPWDNCPTSAIDCHPDYVCPDVGGADPGGPCVPLTAGYVRNTYLREHYDRTCDVLNVTGADWPLMADLKAHKSTSARTTLFREQFEKEDGGDGATGYYHATFQINMPAIEGGAFGDFGVLAPNNFNYRNRTLAVNLVGTDVLNCAKSESPETCAANPWVSYDLQQVGNDVRIRNHHGAYSVDSYDIPAGWIRGGKAWAAEQVIGFPISGAHLTALDQLKKVSLMGRPLEGTYEIRIYDVPELEWGNIEDVQLVFGYHYWTSSE